MPSPAVSNRWSVCWSNWKHPGAVLRFGLTAVVGLSADLMVKHWADGRLSLPDGSGHMPVVQVIPGLLDLEWTPNRGAALGFFQGDRWLFLLVSIVAVGFLAYLFSASRREQRGYQFVLGLLMAGVLGNLYDRITLGYVRDMIHIFPGHRWPAAIADHLPAFWSTPEWFPWIFNIADSMLCVGVALMLIHGIITSPPKPTPANADA
jgi:signal peptidase II